MMKWLIALGLTILPLVPSSVMAQGTITWNFDGTTGPTLSPTSSSGSGITGGTISEVNSFSTVTTNLTTGNPSSSGGYNYGTAVDGSFGSFSLLAPYLEIPINVGSTPMAITNIQFESIRNANGAKDYSIRSSVDGFATQLQGSSGSITPSKWTPFTGLLAPYTAGYNVGTGASTLRLYLFNGSNSAAANTINSQVDNIVITYGVPVPEPSTVFGVSAVGMSCLMMFRRSRVASIA